FGKILSRNRLECRRFSTFLLHLLDRTAGKIRCSQSVPATLRKAGLCGCSRKLLADLSPFLQHRAGYRPVLLGVSQTPVKFTARYLTTPTVMGYVTNRMMMTRPTGHYYWWYPSRGCWAVV